MLSGGAYTGVTAESEFTCARSSAWDARRTTGTPKLAVLTPVSEGKAYLAALARLLRQFEAEEGTPEGMCQLADPNVETRWGGVAEFVRREHGALDVHAWLKKTQKSFRPDSPAPRPTYHYDHTIRCTKSS